MEFRFAEPGDEGLILEFVRELAEYERAPEKVVADEALLREEVFEKHHAEVLFVLRDGGADVAASDDAGDASGPRAGREVGFALFFHNFSTWLGRAGIYLEDLFVKPEYRGRGYGKGLLTELARIAVERGCGRLEWSCLNWNQPSIDFYLSLGAERMVDWTMFRLEGDTLEALAE